MSERKIKQPKKALQSKIIEHTKSILTTAIMFIIITSAVVEASLVPTGSMETTIKVGDRLLINKIIFGPSTPRNIPFTNVTLPYAKLPSLREPARNDILVFRYPGDIGQLEDDAVEYWVKRCIGEPGDTILIKDKVVFVNGKEFPIPRNIQYLNRETKPKSWIHPMIFPKGSKWNEDQYGPLTVPKKGDSIKLTHNNIYQYETLINREYGKNVVDIKNDGIYINNRLTEEYIIQEDYYFMIGDNRDDSLDSRFWGYVPRENIVGTPIAIYWSWDINIPIYDVINKLSSVRLDRLAKIVN